MARRRSKEPEPLVLEARSKKDFLLALAMVDPRRDTEITLVRRDGGRTLYRFKRKPPQRRAEAWWREYHERYKAIVARVESTSASLFE